MMNRRRVLQLAATPAAGLLAGTPQPSPIPDKLIVLTFDDAAKTHRTFVAPLLKQLGFGATFFVSHNWMNDRANFMSWEEIAELDRMGFEIGNHSWTHGNFASPRNASHLAGELALVEKHLARAGVPRPVSFAWPGNGFGPEAVRILQNSGYRLARRGMQPETRYGEMQSGPLYDPRINDRLMIPTTGDAYPSWTFEYLQSVVQQARAGKAVVLQFHGVPDNVHPWVLTPPAKFRQYMGYLKQNGFRVVALRDLETYSAPVQDPMLTKRYPENAAELPTEVMATRADLPYWLENMLRYHRFSLAEAASVCALSEAEVRRKAEELDLLQTGVQPAGSGELRILPYPGGRHPRAGFLEGAINPKRGTKASVFLPWDPASYVVVDVPESMVCNLGRIFLAHYDAPTIWDDQNVIIENIDWTRESGNRLRFQRTLPNSVTFGASIQPVDKLVEMEIWIRNFSGQDLTGQEAASARSQVCVMLKQAAGFDQQSNDNKIFDSPAVAVRSSEGDRWILTAWDRFGRSWGNARCPCMHADPIFRDCPFGETVRARGRLWFYEGTDIARELRRAKALFEN
jgi:peptidoglycan/xylan/chitin deacetylase (PgdA/CDA1 family)